MIYSWTDYEGLPDESRVGILVVSSLGDTLRQLVVLVDETQNPEHPSVLGENMGALPSQNWVTGNDFRIIDPLFNYLPISFNMNSITRSGGIGGKGVLNENLLSY